MDGKLRSLKMARYKRIKNVNKTLRICQGLEIVGGFNPDMD